MPTAMTTADPAHTVVDVGGTTLRVGTYTPATGELSRVRRMPVDGMARDPEAPVPVLQERVVEQIVREAPRSARPPRSPRRWTSPVRRPSSPSR
ncbi:hypothetical protein ABZ366_28275, partial [Streptomyces sp. NPDC005904]